MPCSAVRLLLAATLLAAAAPVLAIDATVTATSANVRSGPGPNEPIVGSLPKGTTVEVVEVSGVWLHVKTRDGKVHGWVSTRLLAKSTTPAAAAAATAAPVAAAPAAPAAANRAGMGIAHKDVSCVVAERFVKLDACFTPADSVARAQVHFRAVSTSPWYSVDMKAEGACLTAILPKPKPTTPEIQYFVYAIDRQFGEAYQPEGAPGRAFKPKVVKTTGECQSSGMMGGLPPGNSISVNVARDAGGKLVNTAVSAAGNPTELAGFSSDGIAGAGGAAAASAAAGGAGGGAGGGIPVLAVAGGVAGAAAIVTVVAVSGGDGEGEGEESLAGTWSGGAANNTGLTLAANVEGLSCFFQWDIEVPLTQNGNTLTGNATATPRSFNCGGLNSADFLPSGTTFVLNATLTPPSGITIPVPAPYPPFTGTYTSTTINTTMNTVQEGVPLAYTLRLTRR